MTQTGTNHKVSFDITIPTTLGTSVLCKMDGTTVATISTTGSSFQSITLPSALSIGSHTISFETSTSVSGSNKNFTIDNVKVFYDVTSVSTICNPMLSIGEYKYGFNGMERDNEVSGKGNSYTAEFWQYDPRLARRWNLDPKPVPWESRYAVNRNNPIWYNDPFGDSPDETKRRERAQKKFDKKVREPLFEMEREGKTPEEIQAQADVFAEKYQRTRWLHYSVGINEHNTADKNYRSRATGRKEYHRIEIDAYPTSTQNFQINTSDRPDDGSLVSSGNTGLIASPGSSVTVNFNPLEQPNALTVTTINQSNSMNQGTTSIIVQTPDYISGPNVRDNFVFSSTVVITTANAGIISYEVNNSREQSMEDTWQLQIQVTSPRVLNPKAKLTNRDYPGR